MGIIHVNRRGGREMPHIPWPFYFINVFIHSSVYVFLVLTPFKSKLRYKWTKTCGIVFFWVLFTAICDVLFFEIQAPFVVAQYLAEVVWIAVSVSLMVHVIKSNFLQLFFVFLVLFAFQNNLIACALLLNSFQLFPMLLPWFEHFNYLLYSVMVLAVATPFLWYLFGHLFRKIVETGIDFMQWKYLYALPLSYFLYCQLSSFGGIDFKQSNCEDFILLLLLNTFAYLAYLAVLNMILESYDVYKWNERVNLMGKQLAMQKGQYEKLTKNMEETARLRHDWRHHLLLIRKYTEERDLVGLEHYLESYFEESTDEEEVPVCSNHSVDIILRHYIALAKQKGISMGVSVDIPDNLKILDYHLCIVFGNLVENAVENCVKQENQPAFVRVKAKPVGEQLAIIVENSYDGEILMDGEEFLSTKHKGGGIGISSVRSIAEEHGGSFRISYEDHVFKVFVLFSA